MLNFSVAFAQHKESQLERIKCITDTVSAFEEFSTLSSIHYFHSPFVADLDSPIPRLFITPETG